MHAVAPPIPASPGALTVRKLQPAIGAGIVAHPVVSTQRETGEAILWVSYSQHLQILAQYQKPENQVRFSWRRGSMAFRDKRAAVHDAARNYGDFPRSLDRILVADEPRYSNL